MTTLATDAKNRAWRTLLQGLAIDVAVAVGFVLYDALQTEAPEYRLLLLSLLKTVLQVLAAFLMRLKTSIAAPPAPVPPPNDPEGEQAGEEPAAVVDTRTHRPLTRPVKRDGKGRFR